MHTNLTRVMHLDLLTKLLCKFTQICVQNKTEFYFSWNNNENYINVTKPYYYGLIPWPFSYFHLKKLTKYYFNQITWIPGKELQEEYVRKVKHYYY